MKILVCNDCRSENLKPRLIGNIYVWECLNCGSPDIVEVQDEM